MLYLLNIFDVDFICVALFTASNLIGFCLQDGIVVLGHEIRVDAERYKQMCKRNGGTA